MTHDKLFLLTSKNASYIVLAWVFSFLIHLTLERFFGIPDILFLFLMAIFIPSYLAFSVFYTIFSSIIHANKIHRKKKK